jgi:hypothetical protein
LSSALLHCDGKKKRCRVYDFFLFGRVSSVDSRGKDTPIFFFYLKKRHAYCIQGMLLVKDIVAGTASIRTTILWKWTLPAERDCAGDRSCSNQAKTMDKKSAGGAKRLAEIEMTLGEKSELHVQFRENMY